MQRKTFTRTPRWPWPPVRCSPRRASAGRQAHPGPRRRAGTTRGTTAALKFAEVAQGQAAAASKCGGPSAQLGDDAAMVTALRTGALDMSANSQGAVANVVPEYAAFGMPFLFSQPAQAWKVLDGPLGKELADKSAEKGPVVLGYWDNGIRHMSNSKKPLLKPEDLKGLKMRTPPDAVTVDIMQSAGRRSAADQVLPSSTWRCSRAWSTGRRTR
jgi:hypothetical protein